jgi:hypothetical protein
MPRRADKVPRDFGGEAPYAQDGRYCAPVPEKMKLDPDL